MTDLAFNSCSENLSTWVEDVHDNEPLSATSEKKYPGNIAVWILIYAELTEFGLMFLAFLIAKLHNQEIFYQGPSHLNTLAGMSNTLVLITSSFFVAKAVSFIKSGNKKACLVFLYLTLLCGATYMGIKVWEYQWNQAADIHSRSDLFFSVYYYLSFNHWLHVAMGMSVIAWVIFRLHLNAYDENDYEGLESAASYWHMIDIVWIIIFPLLYVLR